MGILPPLDALFPWLAEQTLVLVLGGSPLATDLRLVNMSSYGEMIISLSQAWDNRREKTRVANGIQT